MAGTFNFANTLTYVAFAGIANGCRGFSTDHDVCPLYKFNIDAHGCYTNGVHLSASPLSRGLYLSTKVFSAARSTVVAQHIAPIGLNYSRVGHCFHCNRRNNDGVLNGL